MGRGTTMASCASSSTTLQGRTALSYLRRQPLRRSPAQVCLQPLLPEVLEATRAACEVNNGSVRSGTINACASGFDLQSIEPFGAEVTVLLWRQSFRMLSFFLSGHGKRCRSLLAKCLVSA